MQNYVLWGGREGYETILNTNMKLEMENLSSIFRIGGRLQTQNWF